MSLAATTTLDQWETSESEMGDIAWSHWRGQKAKENEYQQVSTKEDSQWSEAVPIGTQSPGVEATIRIVIELSTMKPGWDGYRSPSIGAAAISGALGLVTVLEGLGLPRVHVAPVPGGGIQFEWERAGKELEIEFEHDGAVTYLKVEPNGKDSEGVLTLNSPDLLSLLVWLSE